MKNLKRILSLALAGTMLVGMMVVGASAAGFPDADEIEHIEAAETLYALGVITGSAQPDGTVKFAPEGKLDRAAMAKMIAVIMRGKDDLDFANTDKPSFPDVKAGKWYVPYIEYCYNLGYVSGYSATAFGPDDELTATQAARMILNAMGYKWDGTGDWKLATEVQARDIGLYADLAGILPSAVMSRDDAAQMLYNALNKPLNNGGTYTVNSIENKATGKYLLVGTGVGEGPNDITDANLKAIAQGQKFDSWFEAYTVGNSITKTDNTTKAAYGTDFAIAAETANVTVTTTEKHSLSSKYLNVTPANGVLTSVTLVTTSGDAHEGMYELHTANGGTYWTEDDQSELIGQNINVLYKGTNRAAVFGVFADVDSKVVYTGVYGDIKTANNKTTVGGYELETTTTYNLNNDTALGVAPAKALSMKAIDNDGNGKVDTIVVTPFQLGTVTYLTSTVVTITGAGISNKKLTEVVAYEGMAKGDKVAVVNCAADGKPVITKQESVSGLVTSVNSSNTATIDGETYPQNTGATAATLGSTVTLTLWNGYYVNVGPYSAPAGEISKDLALVIKTATRGGSGFESGTPIVRLLLTNGETVDKDYKLATGTASVNPGDLVTYTVKDDVYTLAAAPSASDLGYEAAVPAASYDGATQKLGTGTTAKLIADDAVVVIAYNTKAGANDSTSAFGDDAATPSATSKTIADVTAYKAMTAAGTGTTADATSGFTGNYGDFDKLIFFKFTAAKTKAYKLEIKKAGTVVYTETIAADAANNRNLVVYVDTLAANGQDSGMTGTWANNGLSAAGTYTYVITNTTDNEIVLGGFFTK